MFRVLFLNVPPEMLASTGKQAPSTYANKRNSPRRMYKRKVRIIRALLRRVLKKPSTGGFLCSIVPTYYYSSKSYIDKGI